MNPGRPVARSRLRLAALGLAVIAVQLGAAALGVGYVLTQLTMTAYYALVIIGLSLLLGYCGQISLGHAAFFAIGGYTTAVLSPRGVPPVLALLAALVACAAVAVLIGLPVLRLRGHYLAMATLGFGTMVYRVLLGTRLFGEADGITGVGPFRLPFGLAVSGAFSARVGNYYIAWTLVLVGVSLLQNLIDSRMGRALRALHGGEEAAGAVGVDTGRLKLAAFVLSALYAAVGGFFMTHFNGGIGPSEAGAMKSVRYVAIVAIGGMANVWGALGLGVLLNFLSLRGAFGTFDDAVFGLALIAILLYGERGRALAELWWARACAAVRRPRAGRDSPEVPPRPGASP